MTLLLASVMLLWLIWVPCGTGPLGEPDEDY